MNRVWTVLLLIATVVVGAAVVYVLTHDDKVPAAGETPGYSTSASPVPTGSGSRTKTSTASSGATGSGSNTTHAHSSTRIGFLGDNWVAGKGTTDKAKRFGALIADSLGVHDSIVAADGAGYAKHSSDGHTFADLVSKLAKDKPDIVVVTGGRNDISDDVDTLNTAAKKLFADLHTKLPHAKLVAVAPFWGDSDHPGDLSKVNSAVKVGVEAAGGTYLNIADPVHGHSDWMADSANPNDKGNAAIASALEPELKKLLPA